MKIKNSDIKSLTSLERVLRQEIANMIKEREDFEETIQFVNNKISQAALELQKSKAEWTLMSVKIEDLRNENHILKESVNHKEKENTLIMRTLEKKELENSKIKEDLERAHILLEANQSANQYLEFSNKRKENFSQPPHHNNFSHDYSPYVNKQLQLSSFNNTINPYDSPIGSYRNNNRHSEHSYNHSSFAPQIHSIPIQNLYTPARNSLPRTEITLIETKENSESQDQGKFECV